VHRNDAFLNVLLFCRVVTATETFLSLHFYFRFVQYVAAVLMLTTLLNIAVIVTLMLPLNFCSSEGFYGKLINMNFMA
jgi:hypothetical protein